VIPPRSNTSISVVASACLIIDSSVITLGYANYFGYFLTGL
jgi:hypothetical protein